MAGDYTRGMGRWRWIWFGVAVGTLFVAERLRPLRVQREPGVERLGRNLTIAMLGALASVAGEVPMVEPAQRVVARRRIGLVQWLPLPGAIRAGIGFLLLDYTLYHWHRLNHESPFLWRFHAVHHLDRDLDTTTGLRFHFGELALASGLRALQVLLIGVDRATLRAFQYSLVASVLFQHSNLELPDYLEAPLQQLVVTPRMHGIHHATREDWMNTNFSSMLTIWDRLHCSLRLDVRQSAVTVGVEGHQRRADVTIGRSLAFPFRA